MKLSTRISALWTLSVLVAACSGTAATPIPTAAPVTAPPLTLPPIATAGSFAIATPGPTPVTPTVSVSAATSSLAILVLGDSIAAGSGVPNPAVNGWWVDMRATLEARHPDVAITVTNVAKGGTKVDYLEQSVAAIPDLTVYDVAVVVEGYNDLTSSVPSQDWQRRYTAVIQKLEQAGLKVVIGTAPPALDNGSFIDYYAKLAGALRQIADAKRTLVDVEKAWRAKGSAAVAGWYNDRVHPNAAGQFQEAQMYTAAIDPLIK